MKMFIATLLKKCKRFVQRKADILTLKKWCNRERKLREIMVDDKCFEVLDSWFWNVFDEGWEKETLSVYKNFFTEEKDIYVDIGAYIGSAVFYASVAGANKIFAMEANPYSYYLLEENLKRNNDKIQMFQLKYSCVSDSDDKKIKFSATGPDSTAATMMKSNEEKVVWETDSVTLRSYLKSIDFNGNGLIKIDIEGAEILIVDDLIEIANLKKTAIFLSLHPPFWVDKEKNTELILSLGNYYTIFDVSGVKVSSQVLENMLLTEEKKPIWGTEWGNFFEVLLVSKKVEN